ncbi:MAG: hypothetical protein WC966_02595 [Bradymonadales bacterium]
MRIKKRFLFSLLFSLYAFTMAACGDELGTSEDCVPACSAEQVCDAGVCKDKATNKDCDADFVAECFSSKQIKKCDNGKYVYEDCSGDLVCVDGTCVQDHIPECTEGAKQCDGETAYKVCTNGEFVKHDCPAGEKCSGAGVCAGEVVDQCEDGLKRCAAHPSKYELCEANDWVLKECEDEMICKDGECVTPAACEPACTGDAVCVDGECVDSLPDTAIGKPCRCEGASCEKSVNLDELKAIKDFKATYPLAESITLGVMKFPDFFAEGNSGCEEVPEVDGASVGCFRDYKLELPEKTKTVLDVIVLIFPLPIDVKKLKEGVQLYAQNGYCFLGAVNAKAESNQTSATTKMLVDLINEMSPVFSTGDATQLSACPAGSELVKRVMSTGSVDGDSPKIDSAFAACLKACRNDDDCRKDEGYSCIKMPSDDGEKMVCFDERNIDSFKAFIPESENP